MHLVPYPVLLHLLNLPPTFVAVDLLDKKGDSLSTFRCREMVALLAFLRGQSGMLMQLVCMWIQEKTRYKFVVNHYV